MTVVSISKSRQDEQVQVVDGVIKDFVIQNITIVLIISETFILLLRSDFYKLLFCSDVTTQSQKSFYSFLTLNIIRCLYFLLRENSLCPTINLYRRRLLQSVQSDNLLHVRACRKV